MCSVAITRMLRNMSKEVRSQKPSTSITPHPLLDSSTLQSLETENEDQCQLWSPNPNTASELTWAGWSPRKLPGGGKESWSRKQLVGSVKAARTIPDVSTEAFANVSSIFYVN